MVVGPGSALGQQTIRLSGLNWLGDGDAPGSDIRISAKVRSTQEPVPALLSIDDNGNSAVVTLDTPERAVAPGQACVFYDGERLLGGGWIQRAA